jgi:hypothetical protein
MLNRTGLGGSQVPNQLGKRNEIEAGMNADNAALAEGSRSLVPFNFTGFQVGNASFEELMHRRVFSENPMTAGTQGYLERMQVFLSEYADWAVDNPEIMGNLLQSSVLTLKNKIFTNIFPIRAQLEDEYVRDITFYGRTFIEAGVLNTRPREISFEVSTIRGTLEYAAQAVILSRKRLQMPGGVQMMNMVLDNWNSGMAASLILRAQYQFFNEPEYFSSPLQLYPNSPIPDTPPKVLELERPKFGGCNRDPLFLRQMIINANAVLGQAGGTVGNIVMTADDKFFLAQMNRSNLVAEFAGNSAEANRELGANFNTYNGVNLIDIPLVGVDLHNQLDQNIFAQPVSNGTYAWFDASVYQDVPANLYRTHMSDIEFCSWTSDTWDRYTVYDTIRHTFEFHPLQEHLPALKDYVDNLKDASGAQKEGQVDVQLLIEIADRVKRQGKFYKEPRARDGINYAGREYQLDALLKYHQLPEGSKESMWTPILFVGQLDERLVPTEHLLKMAEVMAVRMGLDGDDALEKFMAKNDEASTKTWADTRLKQMGFTLHAPTKVARPPTTAEKAAVDALTSLQATAAYISTASTLWRLDDWMHLKEFVPIVDALSKSTNTVEVFKVLATVKATDQANLYSMIGYGKLDPALADSQDKIALRLIDLTRNRQAAIRAAYYGLLDKALKVDPNDTLAVAKKKIEDSYGGAAAAPARPKDYNDNQYFLWLLNTHKMARLEAARAAFVADEDDERRRTYADTLPMAYAIIFLALLDIPITLQNLRAFSVNNIPLPLGALILRPWETQIMHSMVATIREPIGETMVGSEGMDKLVTYRRMEDAFFIEGSIRSATKIFNHRGFHVLRYVRGGQRLGGKGNEFINDGTTQYAPEHWEENVLTRLGRGDLLGNRSNIAVLQGVVCEPGNGEVHFDVRPTGDFSEVEFNGRRMDYAAYQRKYASRIGLPAYVGQAVIGNILKLASRPQPRFGPTEMSFRNTRRIRQHNYVVSKTNVRMFNWYSPDKTTITQSHHQWGDQLPGLRGLESSDRSLSIADHFAPGTSLLGGSVN